jgi:hypothetical protein
MEAQHSAPSDTDDNMTCKMMQENPTVFRGRRFDPPPRAKEAHKAVKEKLVREVGGAGLIRPFMSDNVAPVVSPSFSSGPIYTRK